MKGEPGHQDAELRTKFSINAVKDAGIPVEKLDEDTANWDRVQGQEKMSAFLASHGGQIEAVFANNDDMVLGAIDALKANGYFKENKRIPVVGVNATAPALKAMEDGTLVGTVLNDVVNQGKAIFALTCILASGQSPRKESLGFDIRDGKYIWVPYKKITNKAEVDIHE